VPGWSNGCAPDMESAPAQMLCHRCVANLQHITRATAAVDNLLKVYLQSTTTLKPAGLSSGPSAARQCKSPLASLPRSPSSIPSQWPRHVHGSCGVPCGAAVLDGLLTITVCITKPNFSLSFAGHVPYDFRPNRSHDPQTVPWCGSTARRRVGDGI